MVSSDRSRSSHMGDIEGKGILYEDDDAPIQLVEEDDAHTIRELRMSLIGKVLNPKKQNVVKLIQSMPTQWKMEDRITANDLGNGKFLFNFSSEEDLQEVLRQGPFHYTFCMFVLVRWELIVHDDYPWIIPFWVEITGIPLHLWTVKNLKNIGRKLGHIDTMELSAGRLLIDVDTRKPLVFSRKVQSPDGEEVTIKIHYELLFKHCTYCGLLSHEESYCSKKIEEARAQSAKAGVFARVQIPQVNSSRQPLLSDHNGRGGQLDRFDSKRYNDFARNHDMDVYPFKATRTDHWRHGRDDSHDYKNRDGPARRYGEKYGPIRPSAARYGSRYAPYEHRKPQQWREKHRADEVERFNPQKLLTIADKSSHDAPIIIEEIATEHRNDNANASRGSGQKIASTIVTPSRIAFQNEENVMVRERGTIRAITFSPMEKEGQKESHDEDQIIDALQDMDIVGSSGLVITDHTVRMDCDVEDDDLLGEELQERESGGASLVSFDSMKGHKHKHHVSSRSGARAKVHIGARAGATLGLQTKKVVFLHRGSPMKRVGVKNGYFEINGYAYFLFTDFSQNIH